MATAFASLFNKKVGCPSSQDLLDYDQGCLASTRSLRIEAHLADCDFCNAELQLLNRYQNTQDEYSFAEMPSQLRGLAERLLHSTATPFHALPGLKENPRT
jgi:anti-sigma factor RsiW